MAVDHSQKDEIRKWLESWYAVGDKCIPSNSIKWFANDSKVQFNNGPAVVGKDAIEQYFKANVPAIQWMKHDILSFDSIQNRIYNECDVTIVARNDPEQKAVHIHRMNVFERHPEGHPEAGLIKAWMAFYDSGPLEERLEVLALEASIRNLR